MTRLKSDLVWHIYTKKDSPYWWGWRYDPKKYKQIRKSTNHKKSDFTRDEIVEIFNKPHGVTIPKKNRYTIQWLEDYISRKLDLEDASRNTRYVYNAAFRCFKEIYGQDYSLNNITREAIDKIKSKLLSEGKSPATVNDYLRALRAGFERLLIDEKLDRNPFYKFKPMKENPKEKKLTLSELRDFLDFVRKCSAEDMWRLLRIYAGTGRRRTEILFLKHEDVDLEKGIYKPINVKSRDKDKIVRSIPDNLMEDFKHFVEKYPDKEYPFGIYHEDTITHYVVELFKQFSRPDLNLHNLRHTYLTLLSEMSYTARQAQRIIDHRSILTTTRYMHEEIMESPDIKI